MNELALVMIVLNEEEWLPETLRAARELGIDYWFIGDTGCTDRSEQVAREALEGISGEWIPIAFESIGQARSELFRHTYRKAEWLLLLDADVTIKGPLPPKPRNADCYHGTVEGNWEYALPLLVRGDRRWSYRGVTHSYLAAEDNDGNYSEAVCELRLEDRRPGGWRPGKLDEDARLLEAAVEANPKDARSSFYLAATYADLNRNGDALREYGRRVLMDGWVEETFVAMLRRGRLMAERDPYAGLGALLEAYAFRSIRAEPLYSAARLCRQQGWDAAALLFARQAAAIKKPNDRLFVENSLYETWIPLELGIAEVRCGDKPKGRKLLKKIRETDIGEANVAWIDEVLG